MTHRTLSFALPALLILPLAGCFGDSDFSGPHWDPATGYELYQPGDQYVVVATYADADDDSKKLLSAYFPLVDDQIWESEGMIAYSLGGGLGDILGGKGRTLSVWRDYESLAAFVYSGSHQNVMESAGPRLAEVVIEVWTMDGADLPPSWQEADARVQARLDAE